LSGSHYLSLGNNRLPAEKKTSPTEASGAIVIRRTIRVGDDARRGVWTKLFHCDSCDATKPGSRSCGRQAGLYQRTRFLLELADLMRVETLTITHLEAALEPFDAYCASRASLPLCAHAGGLLQLPSPNAMPFDRSVVRQLAHDRRQAYKTPDTKLPDKPENSNYDITGRSVSSPAEMRAAVAQRKNCHSSPFLPSRILSTSRASDHLRSHQRSGAKLTYRLMISPFGENPAAPSDSIWVSRFSDSRADESPDYYDEACVFLGAS